MRSISHAAKHRRWRDTLAKAAGVPWAFVPAIPFTPVGRGRGRGYTFDAVGDYGASSEKRAEWLVSPTHPARSRDVLGAPLLIVGCIPRA